MEAELAKSDPRPDSPGEALRRIRAIGFGYLRFALAEPGLFRTAFCRSAKDYTGHNAEEQAANMVASPAFQMLSDALDQLVAVGLLASAGRPFAEVYAWSAVHGLAMLLLDGPLNQIPEADREQAIDRVIGGVIDGLVSRQP
jgi:hypothetical protein